jgi:hypothetical protein
MKDEKNKNKKGEAQHEQSEGSAESLYEKLTSDRYSFLMRARDCSQYTIPTLIPPSGHSSASKFYTPYQGMGARGVNNLSSKLLLTLLPPNAPFFRLQIDDFTLEELTKQEGMRAAVEEGLNKIERAVQSEIEASAIRVSAFEAIKHLVVGGNVLCYLPDEGGMRVFPLERYVVQRDPMGKVLDIIVKETSAISSLPKDVRELLGQDKDTSRYEGEGVNTTVDIYTRTYLEDGKWETYQEVKGMVIEGSTGTYPKDKSPWIPVRFTRVDGENYGRSYVEEYLGDVKSLEGLSQAIVEGSAAAAKVLFMVNPNGTTSQETLANAGNGAVVEGTEQDVSVLQLNKQNDFRVALDTINTISERLSFAFLLNSAVQRSGDRVTAEEIRFMAGELESALGGIYSILSLELQLPMVSRLMFYMERKKKLPVLPKGTVRPQIITGMEALGRGNDLTKLDQFIQPCLQVPALAARVNLGDYLTRRGTALGIDMKGLIKSDDDMAQEQQAIEAKQAQEQQMDLLKQSIPSLAGAGGGVLKQHLANHPDMEMPDMSQMAQQAQQPQQ